ncbi:13920_t:CDS:1, partial [Funneliformis mosseae]
NPSVYYLTVCQEVLSVFMFFIILTDISTYHNFNFLAGVISGIFSQITSLSFEILSNLLSSTSNASSGCLLRTRQLDNIT